MSFDAATSGGASAQAGCTTNTLNCENAVGRVESKHEHDPSPRPPSQAPSFSLAIAPHGWFAGVLALAFIGGTFATAWACRSMSTMGEMPMPGGWSMSTIWTPSCGQTWFDAALAFVLMWTLMMATMMLPSSTPELHRLRQRVCAVQRTAAAWTALLTLASYLLAWAGAGMIVFIVGNALATTLPRAAAAARLVPIGSALVVVVAGAVQFTSWKARTVGCVDTIRCEGLGAGAACAQGFRLAFRSVRCCANLMAVLLVVGVMNGWAMAGITVAMTLERHARKRASTAAWSTGIALAATGLSMAARALAAR